MFQIQTIIPYVTLSLLVVSLLFVRSKIITRILLVSQLAVAYLGGLVLPLGLFAIACFWGLCEYHWRRPAEKKCVGIVRMMIIIIFALGFANHLVPGFQNLKVFDALQLSPLSLPYTMYLNMDKTLMAVILVVSSNILVNQNPVFNLRSMFSCGLIALLCMAVLMPLAILSGHLAFDPKLPQAAWLWVVNNLLLVCFAEEVLFRGIIQHDLMQISHRWKIFPFISILIAALLFATTLLGHLHGGVAYVLFVTIAGLFYGYAYYRAKRLEAAIGVHFLVNAAHFFLFTYPMAS
jgi:membrane protease YdiL (CAAX protease family)